MSIKSVLVLPLNASSSYVRIVFLLILACLLATVDSFLSGYIKALLAIGYLGCFYYIYRHPFPYPSIEKLVFDKGRCFIYTLNKGVLDYDAYTVPIELGVCFVLKLTKESASRYLILFNDQMSAADYRLLILISLLIA